MHACMILTLGSASGCQGYDSANDDARAHANSAVPAERNEVEIDQRFIRLGSAYIAPIC